MSSIYDNFTHCTYVTFYRGNLLPPFYIGSSTIENVLNGYHGSVSSKKYKSIWKKEIKTNPNLFVTKIVTKHKTDKEARQKELYFQQQLNVVNSNLYSNESFAIVNGFFGRNVSGKDHPSYGKKFGPMSEEQKKKISETLKGVSKSEKHKMKMRKPKSDEFRKKLMGNQNAKGNTSRLGKKLSEETKEKLRQKAKQQWEQKRLISSSIQEQKSE